MAKKKYDPVIALRVSPVVVAQIEMLKKAFGENTSRTIIRAIAETFAKHCEKKK